MISSSGIRRNFASFTHFSLAFTHVRVAQHVDYLCPLAGSHRLGLESHTGGIKRHGLRVPALLECTALCVFTLAELVALNTTATNGPISWTPLRIGRSFVPPVLADPL